MHLAWAQALFLESKEASAWLVLDEGAGRWSVDGTPVEGPGPIRLSLAAGTHRVALALAGTLPDARIEDFKPEDRVGLRADDGRIALDPLPPAAREWVIPVRHELFPHADEETAHLLPSSPERSRLRVRVGVQWVRMAPYDHFGLNAAVDGPFLIGERAELYATTAIDVGAAEHAYAYTASWSMPVLLRTTGGLGLASGTRVGERGVRLGAELNAGLILPAQAGLLGGAAWLAWTPSGSALFVQPQGRLLLPLWADAAGTWQPEALLSLGIPL